MSKKNTINFSCDITKPLTLDDCGKLIKVTKKSKSFITFSNKSKSRFTTPSNAKSIYDLQLDNGDDLFIEISGKDAEQTKEQLVQVLDTIL